MWYYIQYTINPVCISIEIDCSIYELLRNSNFKLVILLISAVQNNKYSIQAAVTNEACKKFLLAK